ncbi:XkdX family protein [Bacillus infantis]
MQNSTMYDSIKKYYDSDRYDNEKVKVFVAAGWITEDEYQTITGETYNA